jgi:hypothetical protein
MTKLLSKLVSLKTLGPKKPGQVTKECLDTAGLTSDLDTKHALDELAHEWVKMAEEAEREDQ